MSETTDKSEIDGKIDTKKSDNSTWERTINYVREEINKCLDGLGGNPDNPDQILDTSKRLKFLAHTLDKLVDTYTVLLELQQTVEKKEDTQSVRSA